jgi:hypothetical protein
VIRNQPIIAIHPIVRSLAAATILFDAIFGNNLGHRGKNDREPNSFCHNTFGYCSDNVSGSHSQPRLALLVIAVLLSFFGSE